MTWEVSTSRKAGIQGRISEIGKIPRRAMGNGQCLTLPHPVHYIHTGTCLISASLQIQWRWHLLIIWATLVCENQRQSKFVFEIMRACLRKQIFSSLINGNTQGTFTFYPYCLRFPCCHPFSLLASSVNIELVSSSVRVPSAMFQHGLNKRCAHQDPTWT